MTAEINLKAQDITTTTKQIYHNANQIFKFTNLRHTIS